MAENTNTERTNFEAWYIAKTRESLPSTGDGWTDDQVRDSFMGFSQDHGYRSSSAQQAWEAWQARASLSLPAAGQEPVAWIGGEEWEQLAWHLCAEENGEESCGELIWEGGPVPEPWGERWMKYEHDAKRMIELVRKFAAPQSAVAAGWMPIETAPKDGTLILVREERCSGLAVLYSGGWKYENGNISYLDPTHWMPLPPAPSTEGEGNG